MIHNCWIIGKILLLRWRLSLSRWWWHRLLLNLWFWYLLYLLILLRFLHWNLSLNLWLLLKLHLLLTLSKCLLHLLVSITMSKVTIGLILTKSLHEIFALYRLIIILILRGKVHLLLHFRHTYLWVPLVSIVTLTLHSIVLWIVIQTHLHIHRHLHIHSHTHLHWLFLLNHRLS